MSQRPAREFPCGRGGAKVVVWHNSDGKFSLQLCPPRYKNEKGDWVDSSSWWLCDVPQLLHALERAQAWIEKTIDSSGSSSSEGVP